MLMSGDVSLSSREMNRARRKARQSLFHKQKSKESHDDSDEPEKKRFKSEDKKEENFSSCGKKLLATA